MMSRLRGAQPALLNVGDQREVFVTAFEVDKQENAFRFWGQFDNEAVEMLENYMLEAQMEAEASLHPQPGTLSPGDVCLAQFMEDGQWYRARVESVTGNDVIAYFIDYGNTEIIPRGRVRVMQEKVLDLPPQATNCKLANTEPIIDNSTLKAGTHNYLRKQLEYQTFWAEVIACIGGNLEVKLSDVRSRVDVAKQIIADGFGRTATGESSPSKKHGYKLMSLDVGNRERVYVSNVNSPNQFWVQQEKLTKDLDDLMNDMLPHYSKTHSTTKRGHFSRGDPCVTTFSDDGSFYRALVTNTMGSNNYEVFFVDYGNSDVKTKDEILEITPQFLSLPAVAIESCLSDVDPSSCHTDQAAARFEELVAEKIICCKVTRKMGDKCSLLMIDPTGGENADIASVLVKEELAGRPNQMSSPHSKTSPPSGHSVQSGSPQAQSAARELDFQSPKFKKPQIRVGDRLNVQLTSVASGAEFSCHLVKDADKFQALMDKLGKTYSSKSVGEHSIRQVAAGLPCCVQFSEDQMWYRAEVTHIRGQDVEVCYVDYGNNEIVTAAQLKSLKPEFFNLPVQSIKCSLHGVPQKSTAKSQEVKDFLDSTVAELDLCASVEGEYNGVFSIQLSDPATGDNINDMVKCMVTERSSRVPSPREKVQAEYRNQSLKEGEVLQVFVGHVDDDARLYCQKSATVEELEELMDQMAQHFTNQHGSAPSLAPGMPCAAKYPADEAWYRARVTEVERGGKVTVTFVDYGNSEVIDASQIQLLTSDMLQLPAQAIPCILDGLVGGHLSSTDVAKLQELIESECSIEVSSKDRKSGCFVVKMTGPEGNCINDMFRKAQKVERKRKSSEENMMSPPRNDGYASDRRKRKSSDENMMSPPRNGDYASDSRHGNRSHSQMQRKTDGVSSNASFKGKLSPRNDRFQQSEKSPKGKSDAFNRGGSGDATTNNLRMSKSRSDRGSISSSTSERSDRSNRSSKSGGNSYRSDDDRRKGFRERPAKKRPDPNLLSVTPLQFTEIKFPARGAVDVYISHVSNPSEFWCQTAESTPQLQRVMSELHARYGSLGPSDRRLKNTTVGTPCVAQFSEDKCWYRGVVVNKHVKMLEVLFVDYGNSEKVSLAGIKEITPELMKLPVLAVKCSLEGEREWQNAHTEAMKETADRTEPFKCEVKKTDCGVYVVDLLWEGKRMTDVLTKMKLPSPTVAPVTTPAPKQVESEISKVTTPTVSTQNSTAASTHQLMYAIATELECLQVDQVEDVVISYWEGPSRFWCQLAKKCASLDELMDSLHGDRSGGKIDASAIKPGLVCCAKYAEDGAWYRAQVTQAEPATQPEVLFIDYGNKSKVTLADLRVLPQAMTSLPAQAMQCFLSDLTPAQAASPAAVDKFTQLITDKQLVAKVIQKETAKVSVDLHDTSTPEDVNITDEIKKVVADVEEPPSYPPPRITESSDAVYVTNVDAETGTVYIQLASSTEQLDSVTSIMQSTYESCGSDEYQLPNPVVSQACCTKFSEDEQWYRGVVMATTATTATVHFIDYGNREEKLLSDLKAPTEELLNIPHIALECHMDGLPLVPWQQEAADHLLNITAEKELACSFTSTSHPHSIRLRDEAMDVHAEMEKFFGESKGVALRQPAVYPPPSVNELTQTGYVVNVDAASGTVYLQLSSATEQLDTITAQLETTYQSSGNELLLTDVCESQACCTKFSEDDQWYRGVVRSKTATTAHIFFVDYGNSEEKQLTDLRAPPPELLKIPQIALECKLQGIPKLPWQQGAVDYLLEVTADKELTCSFTAVNPPYLVSLKDGSSNINEAMLKLCGGSQEEVQVQSISYPLPEVCAGTEPVYAVNVDAATGTVFVQLASSTEKLDNISSLLETAYGSCGSEQQLMRPSSGQACCTKFSEDEQWYRGIVRQITSSTAEVFFVDYGNSEEKQMEDLKVPTEELLKIPQIAIQCQLDGVAQLPWQQEAVDHFLNIIAEKELQCTFNTSSEPPSIILHDGSCGVNAEMIPLLAEKEGVAPTEGQDFKFKSLAPTLLHQRKAEVYITATTSPGEFWLQPLAGEEALSLLMDELHAHGEDSSTELLKNPAVGTPCVAKYSSDEGWYRGTVTDLDGDAVTVRFVDYGNTDAVTAADLKVMNPPLVQLEAQAICGALSGLSPVDGQAWSAEAAEFFETVVADKLLLMEVVAESDGKLEVKLLDMGMNIGEKLVMEGHAVSTVESVRQFPSVTSEPEDTLEQVSKDLVEKVLVSSLRDLGLEEDGEEDEMEDVGTKGVAEADMEDEGKADVETVARVETVEEEEKQEECAEGLQPEDVAHVILDKLVEDVSIRLEEGKHPFINISDAEGKQDGEKVEASSSENIPEEESAVEEDQTCTVEEDQPGAVEEDQPGAEGGELSEGGGAASQEESLVEDVGGETVKDDEAERAESEMNMCMDGQQHVAAAARDAAERGEAEGSTMHRGEEEELEENEDEKEEDAAEADAGTGPMVKEDAMPEEETFQSREDDDEEEFEDAVATEADQNKKATPTDNEQPIDDKNEENGFQDAVENEVLDVAGSQEQNANPEADQAEILPEAGGDGANGSGGVDAKECEQSEPEAKDNQLDVATLPEDDIAMAVDDTLDGAEMENGCGASVGMSSVVQDAQVLESETAESEKYENTALDAETLDDPGTPGEQESEVAGRGDADESFETARGDVSVSGPLGNGSLCESFSTVSVASGDLDSTLECDKTLDDTPSPSAPNENGAPSLPPAAASPPRCDSGIVAETDEVDDDPISPSISKGNEESASGAVSSGQDDGTTILNGQE
ncbi:tudor domain-containing 6-like [Diadema antillarum]|uniref:tudor domain-containing 6-like n=1 Tax=Diadema antillarum TaxID=105358 RepID=UPI003A858838